MTASASNQASRGLVTVVALLSMLGPFSIDVYLPSFQDIEATFDVSRAAMAQTLSFYLAAFAATTLVWGPLSDRFGRRGVVLVSLLAYVVASLACTLSTGYQTFLAARVAQGLAASGGVIVGRAMIRDAFEGPHAQRAMSHVMLVFAIAPAMAPVIGGWLHDAFGWRSVFIFLAGYGLLTVGLVLLTLEETLPRSMRHSIHLSALFRIYGRVLVHGRFLALVLALSAWFGGMFLYIAGAPSIIFDHLGLGTNSFGVQFVPMVAGLMLGSVTSSRLAHRWHAERTVKMALAVMLSAVACNLLQAAWLAPTPWNVIAPLALYAFGSALAMPNATVMALDCFPHNRGVASAVQGFVQMVFNAIAAGIALPLFSLSIWGFAAGQALFIVIAVLLWLTATRRYSRTDQVY